MNSSDHVSTADASADVRGDARGVSGADAPRSGQEVKRKRRWLIPGAILLLGLVSAVGLVATRPVPERVVAERAVPSVSASVLEVRDQALEVEGTGTVRPTAEITLSAQVAGKVVSASSNLARGAAFDRGEVLLVLERASYENAVAIARADVAQRRVDVALARQEQVVASEEYRLLGARRGNAQLADTSLGARLALRQPQFEAAQASLARSEAQLSDALLNLERTVLRAPFAGRVRSESVDVGQFVSPGQSVAELYSTDEVEVAVSLSTRQASLIADLWNTSGDNRIPATVRADFGGILHEWDGYVDRAAGSLDETTRTVDVIVRVERPFDREGLPPLLVGSYVRASIEGRRVDGLFAIPRPALRDGSSVWVVSDETVRTAAVEVVQEIQDTVFVTGDLRVGDQVVISDLAVMTEGMQVTTGSAAALADGSADGSADDSAGESGNPTDQSSDALGAGRSGGGAP